MHAITVHMQEGLLAKVVSRLTLPDANLQTACTELLKNVAEIRGERYSIGWESGKGKNRFQSSAENVQHLAAPTYLLVLENE